MKYHSLFPASNSGLIYLLLHLLHFFISHSYIFLIPLSSSSFIILKKPPMV